MALRQLQARQTTVNPAAHSFRKPITAAALNRQALGNVSNKQTTTNTRGQKGKNVKFQQGTKATVKNVTTKTKGKVTADQAEHVQTKSKSSSTNFQAVHPTSQPEAGEEISALPCEPMSPAGHGHRDERSMTPQPMDVGEVAGALQRKLHLEETADEAERMNPQFCTEYIQDIYHYLRDLEERVRPTLNYMLLQPHINYKMRAILIDWLVLVQVKFNLLPETLHLTVSIVDRFLGVYPTTKDKLQLVGVTAMLIASKYEEIYFPQVQDFSYITDHSYSADEIRKMERFMLQTIGYRLGSPAAIHFLRRLSKLNQVNCRQHTMAKFFLELSLVSYSMLAFLPSKLAASALYLARKLIPTDNKQLKTATTHYGDYREEELQLCCSQLASLVKGMHSSKQQAVREKYSNSKFLSIAKDPTLRDSIIQELAAQK